MPSSTGWRHDVSHGCVGTPGTNTAVTITPLPVQDDHVVGGKTSHWKDRGWYVYAGLLNPTFDPKGLTTPIQHFRHEWQAIQCAIGIKRRQDLLRRAYDYLVTSTGFAPFHDDLMHRIATDDLINTTV